MPIIGHYTILLSPEILMGLPSEIPCVLLDPIPLVCCMILYYVGGTVHRNPICTNIIIMSLDPNVHPIIGGTVPSVPTYKPLLFYIVQV